MIPLHDALRLGHIEAALVLMDKMDAVGAESWNGLSYIQLLEFAAQGGCSQLVGRLLQTGDPESRHRFPCSWFVRWQTNVLHARKQCCATQCAAVMKTP